MNTKKYISPGGWFSLKYPDVWNEFEDEEGSFLFYNPEKWNGNFRISAYKDRSLSYAEESLREELKNNDQAVLKSIGRWKCAYSCETFMEDGAAYTTHFWITGAGNVSVECSYTAVKETPVTVAEKIIESLEIRDERKQYPKEYIPVRILEINEINMACEWASTQIKKLLKKDFTSSFADIAHMQQIIDSGKFRPQQRDIWQMFGITFGTILVNEMDGLDWITVIDGKKEYPALRFRDTNLTVRPMTLISSRLLADGTCDLMKEYEKIKEEVEKRL